ncbi:MAG: ABC transporter ATP-binding protein [Endomicrobiia bacterium]
MDELVILKNIYKKYKDSTHWVLEDVSLSILKNTILFVCGPSGVGKSTLLHIIGLMDKPTKGEVILKLSEQNHNNLEKIRLYNIGFMFQYHYLIENLTIKENILLPIWAKNKKIILELDEYIKECIKILGIEHILNRYPYEISGGEQQRASLARALANRPKLVIADEPTGNLDQENAKIVISLIKELRNLYNISFVIATHNLSLIKYGDKVISLKDGKIFYE